MSTVGPDTGQCVRISPKHMVTDSVLIIFHAPSATISKASWNVCSLRSAACWLWLCCRPLIWAPGWRGAPAWTTPASQIGTEAPRASASSSLDHYYSQKIKSPKLIFFFPQVLQHIRSNHLPSFRSSSSPKCSMPANTSSHRTLPPGDTCLQGSESDHLSSSLPWQGMCYQLNPSYNSL